jgi:dolichyl-diphosphooligosaccharide--protein glycosyltransferase
LAKLKKRAFNGLAVVLLLLLIMPTLSDTIIVAESAPPAVAGDWYQSLIWLKNNSNSTSLYENPTGEGENSVMDWWDYGNWILYISERPVVANNFQAGAEDAAKFYLSESEENATSLLEMRKSKYIMTDYKMIYGKLAALTTWLNNDININSYFKFKYIDSQIAAVPQPRLFNTTLARLYLLDGAGTGHFRLIYESATKSNYLGISEVKIFEYVPGAIIRVRTAPDRKVGAILNMTSNQGRAFTYVNEGVPNGDALEIRIPYSTEKMNGIRSLGSYLVFSGNENVQKTLQMDVSEKDVLEGKILEVDL